MFAFDNSYARLPEQFYVRQKPVPVAAPAMAVFNHSLATDLGLDADGLAGADGAAIFAGNRLPEGTEPIAQAYAGHQFGHYTMLGDGRAILLGEHLAPGRGRVDIQLKGSGRTPFSRGGDGRAALGPMLREYIISEAMHGLGIPTTRSLAVVTTGEPVMREGPLPGAVLTRVAASHLRVGTFEYAARLGDETAVRQLAEYAVFRHYPEAAEDDNPCLALLNAVVDRQASLIAQWLLAGFVHGVMNTDNMAISGETIDYGPCAFMDAYDPATVFSSIDRHGRYAYGNQPPIAQWNLARFAETLLPLLHSQRDRGITMAEEAIGVFQVKFARYWQAGMRAKLGLLSSEAEDIGLITALLDWMRQRGADYTNSFNALGQESLPDEAPYRDEAFLRWHERWLGRLARQVETPEQVRTVMRAHNPAVIPRNHRVEEVLASAAEGEYRPLQRLLEVLASPYSAGVSADYRSPPPATAEPYRTFCGT